MTTKHDALQEALIALFQTGTTWAEMETLYPELLKRYEPEVYFAQMTSGDRRRCGGS